MGEICGFSLEFVIKGKSTERNGLETVDGVLRDLSPCLCKAADIKILCDKQSFSLCCVFQVSGFSRSHQTSNPLDTLTNLAKKSGSIRQFFTSWRRKPQRDRTDSVLEEDHFTPTVIGERSGDVNGLHTCSLYAAARSNKPASSSDLSYEAESPDEAALVYAAKAYGFTLLARTPDSVTVRLPSGKDLVFEVLDTLAFDATRKRMSILVRHPITKECVLYTKGADYAIMELLGTPYAGM